MYVRDRARGRGVARALLARLKMEAALSAIGVMVTYPIFFAGANESFERGGLADSAVQSLLDRWATWHSIRTGLGIVGFFAALRAIQRS